MPFPLSLTDIVARTGKRTAVFTVPARELLDPGQITLESLQQAGANRYMVISLEKKFGQFITLRPDLPPARYRRGVPARQYVGSLLRSAQEWLDANNFVVIELVGPLALELIVEVDTDHPALLHASEALDAESRRGGTRVPPVKVIVDVVMIDDRGEPAQSRVELNVLLTPLRKMPPYAGYAALDFGNTSTTLMLSDTNQRNEFRLVPADQVRQPVETAGPVQTALRIEKVRPPKQPGDFVGYESRIGGQALEGADNSWLVLGAKRLLSDRRRGADSQETVVLGNEVHHIPAEDPAEVYISRLLQGLFFHRQAQPQSIAVTCPTTFTASEVGRLSRTVARANHRAAGKTAQSFRDGAIDAFVPLVIDEATAAAFYFAHRDLIDGPGQMPAFRYLYPAGMHMLLYDCGGGTTDIALVRLEAPTVSEMRISVLGRAGHRRFGGDFITEQVFRIVKAKLAAAKQQVPAFPKNPGEIADFLRTHRQAIDRAVPTTYTVGQMQNEAAQRRRRTTLDLWRLAESLKIRLSGRGVSRAEPSGQNEELSLLSEILRAVGRPEGLEDVDVAAALPVSRQEINALVDPDIDLTIAYANDLLYAGLESAPAGAEASAEIPEVDRVYVVGNASRYPRILERLRDPQHGLKIRFLEQRLAEVGAEDFKNSVAKGAIVALRMARMDTSIQVSWDSDFMRRLPFDLVNETLAKTGDSVLFRRGELYSARLRSSREIAPDPRTGQPTTQQIRIDRRWPGEKTSEPCMIFQFEEPIAGRFTIRYDEDREAFVMHPDRVGGEDELLVVAEPFEPAPATAPPQSGLI